jgi:tetratricopeptide (TPR) repeat protein
MRAEDGFDLARLIAREVATGRLSRAAAEVQLAERFRPDCPACHANHDQAIAALYAPAPAGVPTGSRLGRDVASFLSAHPPVVAPGKPPKPPPKRQRKSRALPPEVRQERERMAFEELQRLPWARRRERVNLLWQSFRGLDMARRCLAAALAALPGDPEDSGRWAELALVTLQGKRGPGGAEEAGAVVLRCQARLLQANAARCRGELAAAGEEIDVTLEVAGELDVRDLGFWFEAKRIGAAWHRDARDFTAAIRESRAAAALARAAGLPRQEVQARANLTSIYEQQGDFAGALVAIRQALSGLPDIDDGPLTLSVRHSEVFVLARLKRLSEAEALLEELTPRYDPIPRTVPFRGWVRALIHAGLGRSEAAEQEFRAARDGFLAAKNPYDAALVTLDWALFLLDAGRAEEVLPLAVSMGQAFEALGVARETLATWAILQAAAERRELDRAVAEELARTMGDERGVSSRAHEPSSR